MFAAFFEQFGNVDENVKMALLNIQKSIVELYDQNEQKIVEKAKTASDEESLMKYQVYIDYQ